MISKQMSITILFIIHCVSKTTLMLHYLGKHEPRKLCLFSHAGRQRSRCSGAMSRFFAFEVDCMFRKQCRYRDMVYSMTEKTQFGVHVFPGSAETLARRDGIKWPFDSILFQEHLCPKLPKSVDVRWSYSVLHQCRFLRHSAVCLKVSWVGLISHNRQHYRRQWLSNNEWSKFQEMSLRNEHKFLFPVSLEPFHV